MLKIQESCWTCVIWKSSDHNKSTCLDMLNVEIFSKIFFISKTNLRWSVWTNLSVIKIKWDSPKPLHNEWVEYLKQLRQWNEGCFYKCVPRKSPVLVSTFYLANYLKAPRIFAETFNTIIRLQSVSSLFDWVLWRQMEKSWNNEINIWEKKTLLKHVWV